MVLTSSAKKDRLDIYHGGDKDHPNTFGVLRQNSLNRGDNLSASAARVWTQSGCGVVHPWGGTETLKM